MRVRETGQRVCRRGLWIDGGLESDSVWAFCGAQLCATEPGIHCPVYSANDRRRVVVVGSRTHTASRVDKLPVAVGSARRRANDLAKRDLPCSSMREPVRNDCLYERRGEVGGCIHHRIAPGPRREAGVCESCSQRRSDMPLRHDLEVFRKRCPDQERLDQAPRITAFGHVNVEPNPDRRPTAKPIHNSTS